MFSILSFDHRLNCFYNSFNLSINSLAFVAVCDWFHIWATIDIEPDGQSQEPSQCILPDRKGKKPKSPNANTLQEKHTKNKENHPLLRDYSNII